MNSAKLSGSEYPASKSITKTLCDLVLEQNHTYSFETYDAQTRDKFEPCKAKCQQLTTEASLLKLTLPDPLQHTMELAQEKVLLVG